MGCSMNFLIIVVGIFLCTFLDIFTCFSSATATDPNCTSGFKSLDVLQFGDIPLPTRDINFNKWVFPTINFSCDMQVTGWIFQGEEFIECIQEFRNLSRFQNGMPYIEVWRDNVATNIPENDLRRIGVADESTIDDIDISLLDPSRSSCIATYQYNLIEPLDVQSGDIVGIAVRNGQERVRMRFLDLGENVSGNGILSYRDTRVHLDGSSPFFNPDIPAVVTETRYVPLLTVLLENGEDSTSMVFPTISSMSASSTQILPTPTSSLSRLISITTPPSTPQVTTTTLTVAPPGVMMTETESIPPPTARRNGADLNLIIGAVVAVLFVIVLVLIAVLIALVVIRKRQNVDAKHTDLDNPSYQTVSNSENKANTITPNGRDPIYDQPLPSPTYRSQVCSPHLAAESNLDGIVINHYEFSQDMVPSQQDPLSPFGNDPEYAQPTITTMSRPYEVPLSTLKTTNRQVSHMNHEYSVLEGGIYVPTEEERQSLSQPSTAATTNTGVFDDNIYSRMSKKYRGRLDEGMFFQQEDSYWKPASSKTALYDQLAKKKYREIMRQQIQIVKHLGSGQFGTVNKGLWQSQSGTIEVAVKTLQPLASENDKVKFLQEAAIMGQFLHPNVVKLYGVVTVGEPVMIVLEYMQKGDLRNYLLSRQLQPGELVPNDLPLLLIKFCREIASGMNYLSNKSFVHRDLAARNILLAEDNTCKIGDFGMSRDLEDNNYYITHGGKIPVKWTAPEALHFRRYSNASDVWSFGCVMYEIWSLGHKPLEGYSNIQAMQLIGSGYRMAPPPGCPRALYELMIRCWHSDASRRPTFSAIFNMLSHSDTHLLSWSDQDKAVHPQASCLGAALEAGDKLYSDLQDYYIDKGN